VIWNGQLDRKVATVPYTTIAYCFSNCNLCPHFFPALFELWHPKPSNAEPYARHIRWTAVATAQPNLESNDTVTKSSPLLAHRADLGSEFGTSFASPRACGDVVKVMADPARRANCNDAIDLICETYGVSKATAWNARNGYHTETS